MTEITDEIVEKAFDAYWNVMDKENGDADVLRKSIRAALTAVAADLTAAAVMVEREACAEMAFYVLDARGNPSSARELSTRIRARKGTP